MRPKALRQRAWIRATVALGGNLGDVPTTLLQALRLMEGPATEVLVVSQLYRSLPLRLPNDRSPRVKMVEHDNVYTNAVCALRTLLGPRELLRRLQKIERQLGRKRCGLWGPRTIDLDLLMYGSRSMSRRILTLPHPGMAFRAFVLAPLRAINATHPWPNLALSVDDLLQGGCDASWGIVHKQLSWRSSACKIITQRV